MAKEKQEENPVADADAAAAPGAVTAEAGAAAEGAAEAAPKVRKVKGGRIVSVGIAHIKATFNNTQISITDMSGNVIAWGSSGRAGFKGSRKSTAFAATMVCQEAGKQAVAQGMREIEVRVQGAGAGRESGIRALQAAGMSVSMIKDVTPMAHNGCRARKRGRV